VLSDIHQEILTKMMMVGGDSTNVSSVAASESGTQDRSRILNINIGVMGHVDTGKTTLVKAMSSSLSAVALDKSPQTPQRGLTLDLGFSSFTLPLPTKLKEHEKDYDLLQFTLVDCPGHASLIRTIIGGAQIIDMMILVIDASKGIQTQTAECIVIGEITTEKMIIVLNKVDMIPPDERDAKLERVIKRIQKVLSTTKFHDSPIVLTAAAIGGEKGAPAPHFLTGAPVVPTFGVDNLLQAICDSITVPQRSVHAPFNFAIDHCFAIKGHGTVVTGTVLSGSVNVNSVIEVPNVQIQRRVKSMQVFKRHVKTARQGDRVGICVTHLDPQLIERGIASAPGAVSQLTTVLCLVKKVRFFRTPCKSNTKFHVSIGHSTVVANVSFFGAIETAQMLSQRRVAESADGAPPGFDAPSAQNGFPEVDFNFQNDYPIQEELIGIDGANYGSEPLQWALIQFQQPVFCPLGSMVIGSRLDGNTKDTTGMGSAHQCRLSFFGPIRYSLRDDDLEKLHLFHWETKEGQVHSIRDVKGGLCTELVGDKLFAPRAPLDSFIGLKVHTERGAQGTIIGPYGSDGKFRVSFEPGIRVSVGSALCFRFKKYLYNQCPPVEELAMSDVVDRSVLDVLDDMLMEESWLAKVPVELKSPLYSVPGPFPVSSYPVSVGAAGLGRSGYNSTPLLGSSPTSVDILVNGQSSLSSSPPSAIAGVVGSGRFGNSSPPVSAGLRDVGVIGSGRSVTNSPPSVGIIGSGRIASSSPPLSNLPPSVSFVGHERPGSSAPLPSAAGAGVGLSNGSRTVDLSSAVSMPGRVTAPLSHTPAAVAVVGTGSSTPSVPASTPVTAVSLAAGSRVGYIESIKIEGSGDEAVTVAIIRDAFRMEENIKVHVNCEVVGPNAEAGTLLGPFGKLGKCKVKFSFVLDANTKVGDAVVIKSA
jgi:selenocysteine-specific elongation factor